MHSVHDPIELNPCRLLNCAEIAQYVSGANYTFFVPTDAAFEQQGFDRLSDEVLASDAGVKLLLNHFIRGRLYERDLRHDDLLTTIGGEVVKIQKTLEGERCPFFLFCVFMYSHMA